MAPIHAVLPPHFDYIHRPHRFTPRRPSPLVRALITCLPLCVLCSCATCPTVDLSALGNPAGRDPSAAPLASRAPGQPAPTSQQIVDAFKALPRPIIRRYIEYEGEPAKPAYTHVALTHAAGAFIRQYTFDELLLALWPLAYNDAYWSGDAVAIISTASQSIDGLGGTLAAARYCSPQSRGPWEEIRRRIFSPPWHCAHAGSRYMIRDNALWDTQTNKRLDK